MKYCKKMYCTKCKVERNFKKELAVDGRVYFECPQCHFKVWREEPVQAFELAAILYDLNKRFTALEQYYFEDRTDEKEG